MRVARHRECLAALTSQGRRGALKGLTTGAFVGLTGSGRATLVTGKGCEAMSQGALRGRKEDVRW